MPFHKLLQMSSEEFLYRSKAVVGRWREEGRWKLGLHTDYGIRLSPLDVSETCFDGLWSGSSGFAAIVQKLRSEHPAYGREIRAVADAICQRQFRLLGVPVQYGPKISWRADPLSGKEWPTWFHTRINIFGGDTGNGDVKYVWELNRHQFIITLGKAYRLTGNERYALVGLALIEDWIQDNPYKIGINWTSALEMAIRSLSWCQACALFENSAAFSLERRREIVRSLYQHGHYIEKHLSFFFSPYNHLVGEATALFVLGHLLSWLKPALRWRDKGWAILEQEMPKQFHSDGGTVEQATGYHHFTLGFYLQAVLLRRRLGLAIPSTVWSLLEKAFEFSMYMMRPDGSVPMIGDGDDGKALDLLQTSVWDFRSFLTLGAVLFQRGDFKKMAGSFPPDAAWLLGSEGWKAYDGLGEREPLKKSKALPKSGYYIMRTGWDQTAHYLTFDCGEIAAGVRKDDIPSAAHGHADALSIEVSAYGVPTLVDPGFYTYNGDEKWHRYFRETEAHNTVVVDGRSQAQYRGRLKWSHAPQTKLDHWVTSRPFDYVEGSHNGYTRLPQAVIHRRAVAFLKPDYWLVRDELLGQGEHQIDRYFHFTPMEVVFDRETKVIHTNSQSGNNLAILSVEKEGVAVEIQRGGGTPGQGWLAIGYGKKAPAPVGRCSTKVGLPIALHTLLVPFREDLPSIEVKTVPVAENESLMDQALMIQIGGKKDILVFSSRTGNKTVKFYKGWLTNGRVTCVRLNEKGSVISCALVDGSILIADGNVLLRTGKTIPFAAFSLESKRRIIEIPEAVDVSQTIMS
jgi:hypothetical protein